MRHALCLALCLALAAPAVALAEPTAPKVAAKKAEPKKRQEIRRLLHLSGSGQLGIQVMDQMFAAFAQGMPNVPAKFWTEVRGEFSADELVELIVPVYERNLTDEDIRALIAFYESPAGRRFVAVLPKITAESQTAGEQWGRKVAERVLARLEADGYR